VGEINFELSFHVDSPLIREVIAAGGYKKTHPSSQSEVKLYCVKVLKPCYDFQLTLSLLLRNP
jgi:hypothetical protein